MNHPDEQQQRLAFERAQRLLDRLNDLTESEKEFARQYADRLKSVMDADERLWAAIGSDEVRIEVIPATFAILLSYAEDMVQHIKQDRKDAPTAPPSDRQRL